MRFLTGRIAILDHFASRAGFEAIAALAARSAFWRVFGGAHDIIILLLLRNSTFFLRPICGERAVSSSLSDRKAGAARQPAASTSICLFGVKLADKYLGPPLEETKH